MELKYSGETQISLTDPDSRKMLSNQVMEICYNVQVTVDEKNKLILDYEVTNENGIIPYIPERNNEVRKDINPSFYRSKFGLR